MNGLCGICEKKKQRASYIDNSHDVGKVDPKFTGGLIGIAICEFCLFAHASEHYPGGQTVQSLLVAYPCLKEAQYASSNQSS